MNPLYSMDPEITRLEIDQRLHAAAVERRRRPVRAGVGTARRRGRGRDGWAGRGR